MMTTTFRAAYFISNDNQREVLLTGPAHSELPDDELEAIARTEWDEYVGGDLDAEGSLVLGDWTE